MRHAISSFFNAARSTGNLASAAEQTIALRTRSSSMMVLTLDQLRHVVGGDGSSADGLPKGGWSTSSGSTTA